MASLSDEAGREWGIMKGDTISRSALIKQMQKKSDELMDKKEPFLSGAVMGAIGIVQNAPAVAAAPEWISVKDGLPKDRKSVNVAVEHKRDDGKTFQFVMTASYIGHHEIEAEEWPDYDGDTEYDEENDCYWIPENWYEDNFMEDNMNYLICDEYRVTHWMPLPESPKEDEGE